jgi:hypothetical protein
LVVKKIIIKYRFILFIFPDRFDVFTRIRIP